MRYSICFVFFLCSLTVFAQAPTSKFDLRLGAGISQLSNGDMITAIFENELNYRINSSLSASAAIGYGRSNNGVYEQASYFQSSLNIYWSLFRNNPKNDFRIGTGALYINVTDVALSAVEFENGIIVDEDFRFRNDHNFGFNLILENTYTIQDKYLIGLKGFMQPFANGDFSNGGMNSGVLLKFGVRL